MSPNTLRGIFALQNRSMRTDDRTLRTHLFRLAFVGLTYMMMVSIFQQSFMLGAPGLHLFRMICYLNFFYISLAGVSVFATTITEEKEDMTLGLLKMAGISPIALLLGKSTPKMFSAMILLSAQFPFTMLAITLGGVSIHQVIAAYVALMAYLVLVANLALFYSVVCMRSRAASVATGIVLALYFITPSLGNGIKQGMIYYNWFTAGSPIDSFLGDVFLVVGRSSVYRRIGIILTTGFQENAISFQVISNVVAGLLFLIASWCLFERATRNEKPASEPRGLLTQRLGTRTGLLGANRAWNAAITWKDFHFVAGGKMMILAKFVLFGGLVGLGYWAQHEARYRPTLEDLGGFMFGVGMAAALVEIGIHASRVFYTEVKWKTLSSLATLPQSMGQIAWSKAGGVAIALVPAATYFFVGAWLNSDDLGDGLSDILDEPGFWYMASQYVLFVHLAATLSLYVKWGAFPLAIGAIYAGNLFFVALMVRGPTEAVWIVLTLLSFIACGFLQFLIGKRLRALAAT